MRRLVPLAEVDATVALYEQVLDVECSLRFDYPEAGLVLAGVGAVLIIGGDDATLAPFRATDYTLLVASLDDAASRLQALGVEIVEADKPVPTGRNMLVRLPDGALVEYVEHRTQPGEGQISK